mmetsp:Transcript_26154/g.77395  ORF Transcript_26154/g.77395 Transcript_26154/m.77395 type:complete len:246 (+) Transcript_26154:621-1358(+)
MLVPHAEGVGSIHPARSPPSLEAILPRRLESADVLRHGLAAVGHDGRVGRRRFAEQSHPLPAAAPGGVEQFPPGRDDLVPQEPSLVGTLHLSREIVDGLAGREAVPEVGRLTDGPAHGRGHDPHVGPLHRLELDHLVPVGGRVGRIGEVQHHLTGRLLGSHDVPEVLLLLPSSSVALHVVLVGPLEDQVRRAPGSRDGEHRHGGDALVGRGGRRRAEGRPRVEGAAGAVDEVRGGASGGGRREGE